MEVRRSRHGKVALVVGGNSIIKFVMLDANGPKFGSMVLREFNEEFNANLSMTVETAALSFLKSAKRAFKHNQEVINFLLDEILMKNLSDLALSDLVLRYNSLCAAANKKPRKSFDSKAKALEAIEQLDAVTKVAEPEQILAAEKSAQRRSKAMSETGAVQEVKVRGKGIGKRAMELLIEGKSTKEVIDTVKAEIPGANPTGATIAWYKNKLRQDGKLPALVKKEKVVKEKKAKAAPAVDPVDPEDDGEGE